MLSLSSRMLVASRLVLLQVILLLFLLAIRFTAKVCRPGVGRSHPR